MTSQTTDFIELTKHIDRQFKDFRREIKEEFAAFRDEVRRDSTSLRQEIKDTYATKAEVDPIKNTYVTREQLTTFKVELRPFKTTVEGTIKLILTAVVIAGMGYILTKG